MTPIETKMLTNQLNESLVNFNKTYPSCFTNMLMSLHSALNTNNFVPSYIAFIEIQKSLVGLSGHTNVEMAPNIFLSLSWYQMESGNFEVVTHTTSKFDDYREPYTTKMTKQERTKARNAVNDAISAIVTNKYFDGKATPFIEIQNAVRNAGLDYYEFEDRAMFVNTSEGRLHVSVGNDLFLLVTWYKMESGRYEIVAYVS